MITDRAGVAFDDGGEAHRLATDEIHGGGIGENFADSTDDTAAKNDRRADREVVIFAFADGETLPPTGEIAADDACVLRLITAVRRQTEDAFEAGDFTLHLDVLLDGEIVGSIEAGEVAAGLDELAVGVEPERPVFLEIACVRGRDTHGRGEFEERGAGKGLENGGYHEPCGHDQTEREKRSSLV